MSYYRAIKVVELTKWLLENGLAEEQSGFGHVSAEDLAQKLVDKFDIMTYSQTQ